MAYRRRQQGISKPFSTFEEFADKKIREPHPVPVPPSSYSSSFPFGASPNDIDPLFSSSSSSLAAKAISASLACRDSSLSSAYGHFNLSSDTRTAPSPSKDSITYEYTSMKSMNESKRGFLDVLAKSIVEDDDANLKSETSERMDA